MNRQHYKQFLIGQESITSKYTAVNDRLRKASKIENQYGVSLERIVSDDLLTYSLLKILKLTDHHGNNQNTVRKYYLHKNDKEFPRLMDFELRFKVSDC